MTEQTETDRQRLQLRDAVAITLAQAINGGRERCPNPRTSQVVPCFAALDALLKLIEFERQQATKASNNE